MIVYAWLVPDRQLGYGSLGRTICEPRVSSVNRTRKLHKSKLCECTKVNEAAGSFLDIWED